MSSFVIYQIKAALCIMVFTSLYYLLFRKETFHRLNRFILMGMLMLSFILPLIRLRMQQAEPASATRFIGSVTVYANRLAETSPSAFQPGSLLSMIYLAGVTVFLLYFVIQLLTLLLHIRKGEISRRERFVLVSLPGNRPAFSFFNLIFMNRHTEGQAQVLAHELAHMRQWHSLDILLLQVIKILQWFNPFLYLTERAIHETHEYLADASVMEQDGEADRYRLLLLSRVFGVQPGIFSFFNHSRIKKRMIMLTKQKSPISHRFKYLTVLPVFVSLVLAISCQKKSPAPPPPPPPPPAVTEQPAVPTDTNFFVKVDKQAAFQGGDIETFRDWVQQNLVYPPEAVKAGIFGKVVVQFAVDENGKVCLVKVMRGVSPSLDAETIRVLQSSPDWIPAQAEGKNVRQQFVIPVVFTLE